MSDRSSMMPSCFAEARVKAVHSQDDDDSCHNEFTHKIDPNDERALVGSVS